MSEAAKACLFCAMVDGKIPTKRVYEDGDSLGFLDINPRAKGMTIVMPKVHYVDVDKNPVESIKVFKSVQNVSQMLKSALGAASVQIAIIPSSEVPHFHVRLYPVYGDERPLVEAAAYKATDQELNEMADKIKSAKVDVLASAVGEAAPEEMGISDEDADYIKDQLDVA